MKRVSGQRYPFLTLLASLGITATAAAASIEYIGVDYDQTDFQDGLDYGNAGYWFPHFGAISPGSNTPTDHLERNALPEWAGPMVHMLRTEFHKFPRRTFSQDGPTTSKGGVAAWNEFRLPNGDLGRSGVILDPHAAGNSNNTVNKIMLGPSTPKSFLLRVVVDNTAGEHNAINLIRARGSHAGVAIDAPTAPSPGASNFNGVADVYTFRYDGFGDGDFIKIRFNGAPGDAVDQGSGGASFAGLLFDQID